MSNLISKYAEEIVKECRLAFSNKKSDMFNYLEYRFNYQLGEFAKELINDDEEVKKLSSMLPTQEELMTKYYKSTRNELRNQQRQKAGIK